MYDVFNSVRSKRSYALALDGLEISDQLLDQCSPLNIFRLRRTCRIAWRIVDYYLSRNYNINKHLSRFFYDLPAFRALQLQTNAAISGSTALQFMDRTVYDNFDLDIYVTREHAQAVCNWLLTSSGKNYRFHTPPRYRKKRHEWAMEDMEERFNRVERDVYPHDAVIKDASDWTAYHLNEIWSVMNFASNTDSQKEKTLHVQVIVTLVSPAASVLSFHSTVVMNISTYYGAYSLYPKATFDERRALVCCMRPIDHEEAVKKYEVRGWTLQRNVTSEEQMDKKSSFRMEDRWIGDTKTWFVPFNKDSRDIDLVTLNGFSLAKDPERTTCETKFAVLQPAFFDNHYVASFNLLVN